MNAVQRKFLVDKIELTFKKQVEAIEKTVPEKPSMNRYLIGAFLDGSIKILDSKRIKDNLKKYVKALGSKELIKDSSTNYRRYKNSWDYDNDDEEDEMMMVVPSHIMEIPKTYIEATKEYTEKRDAARKAINALRTQRDTLVLKINIGSNQILDKLIMQVDSLGDLDLFSNQLSLIAGDIKVTGRQQQINNADQKQLDAPKRKPKTK